MTANTGVLPTTIKLGALIRYAVTREVMIRWERLTYNRKRYLRFLPKYIRMQMATEPIEQQLVEWIAKSEVFYWKDWIYICADHQTWLHQNTRSDGDRK